MTDVVDDGVQALDDVFAAGPDPAGHIAVAEPLVPAWAAGPRPAPRVRRAGSDGAAGRPLELGEDAGSDRVGDGLGGRSAAWSAGYRDGHAQGRAEGHAAGLVAGHRDGLDAARAGAEQAVADLADALGRELAGRDRRLAELADEVLDLAVGLAEAVLGHHVAATADPGSEALRRALAAAPVGPRLVAHLHPDDVAALSADPAQLAPGRPLEVVADPATNRGDCRLTAGPTSVDATLGAALGRVRDALTDALAVEATALDPSGPPARTGAP